MNKQLQIVEMARDICRVQQNCNDVCKPISACDALRYAERAYEAGHRKQSEGEWIAKDDINGRCSIAICSNCGTTKGLAVLLSIEQVTKAFPYCEKCGARMKGDAE